MDDRPAKQRFDELATLLAFDEAAVSALRASLSLLMPRVSELVQAFDGALKRAPASLFGSLEGERRDTLQSLAANFVLRTISCNFDEDYCNFVAATARNADLPGHFIELSLTVTQDVVMRALPGLQRDLDKLAQALSAWAKLISMLKILSAPGT
ncbi:MAG: hypothetical protein IT462_02785 [Planctomycetes bacterium]|nr:hypothetical protein [Planctomycetota bacterium]